MPDPNKEPKYCINSTQHCIYTRRCFVTGELCSKQTNIYKERELLHAENEINAFVIMNFSEMSDVVYKWKLRSFIESLKHHLYLDKQNHQIACVEKATETPPSAGDSKWEEIKKINVIRADSNTASNYIICSRICQQIQIADLVIVDVSVENTNVFYEFGLAAAFGKLILPICYNESFYEMNIPEKAKELLKKASTNASASDGTPTELEKLRKQIEHHIDCYPWRRKLFENYGIRYRRAGSQVRYGLFDEVIKSQYGFSDQRYGQFPYDATIEGVDKPKTLASDIEDWIGSDGYQRAGYLIYDRLRASYQTKESDKEALDSESKYEEDAGNWNTLMVYTMDGMLNGDQAGLCIINFYKNMTYQIQAEHCFCGDRVAVLSQSNVIPDDPKDTKLGKKLLYGVGDILRIGMNQATHEAHQKRIKTDDYLLDDENDVMNKKEDDTIRFVKEHIRNRCVPLLSDEPIYVEQYKNGIQQKLFHTEELDKTQDFDHAHFFTMFHMMLYTLRYTNEIVVDISGNSLQALFWLGVAHGSDIPAITVRHAPSTEELNRLDSPAASKDRRIFDVSGLWTAMLNANDVDSFYDQLALTQTGIEQHNRLTLPSIDAYRDEFMDLFYETWRQNHTKQIGEFEEFIQNKRVDEGAKLESYYRNRFWRRLLRSNELDLFIARYSGEGLEDKQPRILDIAWDIQATSELNKYLSKRTVIGQYTLREINRKSNDSEDVQPDPDAESRVLKGIHNYITLGGSSNPLPYGAQPTGRSLAEHIQKIPGCEKRIRKVYIQTAADTQVQIRGFCTEDGKSVCRQFPTVNCIAENCQDNCTHRNDLPTCGLRGKTDPHEQLAQIVLWREINEKKRSEIKFWVSLIGVSGPSTLALTSLLIDEKQKKSLFTDKEELLDNKDSKWCKTPLKDLQYHIRKDVMREYDRRLMDKMTVTGNNDATLQRTLSRTTRIYLSTILYRYFFPFLSLSDEKRILNSMHTFLTAMHAADGDTFHNIKKISNYAAIVKDSLRETIESLRGVDVLYTVKVRSGSSSTADDRWPIGMQDLEEAPKDSTDDDLSKNRVICLYTTNCGRQDDVSPLQE